MKKIVLASKNPKKAVEVERIIKSFGIQNVKVFALSEIPEAEGIAQAEESGTTFIENARIKANYWSKKLNMPALGEDSGLEIDALDGAPGVYTKRAVAQFCPDANVDEDKPEELYPNLLIAMQKTGNPSKKAGWVSAIVLAFPNNERPLIEAQNTLYGEMCECAGEKEFGFDQYFIPIGKTETLSQMLPQEKDDIGPRKKSLKEIFNKIS